LVPPCTNGTKEILMFAVRIASLAGLSLMLASPVTAQPAAYTIAMASFSFSPRPIHLAAGRPVTLTFVNRSGSGHDFTAKEFFAASRILAGSAPGGAIDLQGGESRSITLVPAAGTYNAHCSHFLHTAMGMTDRIVVN
jgi:plastocyanin